MLISAASKNWTPAEVAALIAAQTALIERREREGLHEHAERARQALAAFIAAHSPAVAA